jgi:hypothetical protein
VKALELKIKDSEAQIQRCVQFWGPCFPVACLCTVSLHARSPHYLGAR